MKKTNIIIIVYIVIMCALFLLCGALSTSPPSKISNYNVYSYCIASAHLIGRVPDNFMHHRQISALGNFEKFTYSSTLGLENGGMTYSLSNCGGYFSFTKSPTTRLMFQQSVAKTDIENVANLSHMTHLKAQRYEGGITYVVAGRMTYYYLCNNQKPDSQPILGWIQWRHGNYYYALKFFDGTPPEQDTLLGRLLNLETAEAAVDELMADVDGDYEMPAEDWHLIGSGLLFWTTAIALPIVIVKRKRKKKAALAGVYKNENDNETLKNRKEG